MRHFSLLLLSAALACGGGGGDGPTAANNNNPPPPPPGTPNSVIVTASSFTPPELSVARNATVTWTWNSCTDGGYYGDQTCVSHDVVFDDAAAGSGAMSTGSFSRTFSAPGTYQYHCAIHGAAMAGKVVVQ